MEGEALIRWGKLDAVIGAVYRGPPTKCFITHVLTDWMDAVCPPNQQPLLHWPASTFKRSHSEYLHKNLEQRRRRMRTHRVSDLLLFAPDFQLQFQEPPNRGQGVVCPLIYLVIHWVNIAWPPGLLSLQVRKGSGGEASWEIGAPVV